MMDVKKSPPAHSEGLPRVGAAISPLASLSMRSGSVVLGPILPEDTGSIFLWLNDVESIVLDLPYRPVDWMNYNGWLEDFSKNPSQVIFAIRRIHDPKIIGFVVFVEISAVHRSAKFGIRIGAETDRSKGYGKEAIRLALTYAWKHLNLNRVRLSVFDSNRRAIAAYRAAGFQHEGTLREAAYINGGWTDVVLMGALRSQSP
jgi:RimJ/RimL family protein N-acetyltransferase